jgi:hypothetical protein
VLPNPSSSVASTSSSKSETSGKQSRWIAKKPIAKFRKQLDNVPDHYLPRFIELVAATVAPRCAADQQLSRFLKFSESRVEGKAIDTSSVAAQAKKKLAAITRSGSKASRARAELLSSDGLLASAVQAAHNGHYVVNLDDWSPGGKGALRLPQRKCSLGALCVNRAARTSKACVCQPSIALCPKECFAQHCVSLGVAQTPEDAQHDAQAAVQCMPPLKPSIKLVL